MRLILRAAAIALPLLHLAPAQAQDAAATERVRTLVETGMRYYWTGGDVAQAERELFRGITLHGRYDVVERAFAEAAELAPERLDFRYAVASTQIIQRKVTEARTTYREILRRDPRAFEAQAWLAALARVENDAAGAQLAEQGMAALDRARAERYRLRFARLEAILAERPSEALPTLPPDAVIVVLGYALNADGTMHATLLQRLEVALVLARAQPASRLMVSGGQPRANVTEADLMMRWLVEHGIDRDRIFIEDKSKDTVGNVLNVAALVRRHGAGAVALVTSASHMRRARTILEDALLQSDIAAPVLPAIALDFPTLEQAAQVSREERLVVYRDLMRVSGLWAYPGLQQ
jgi:uncharacterized SAM-binding protein YcdF (DUF218 family)